VLGTCTRVSGMLRMAASRAAHGTFLIGEPATGAAMRAAADPLVTVYAVVSRGGRPDVAGEWFARVDAQLPRYTLLIVGGRDDVVLKLNRQAQQAILAECRLAVVPGATHLFEEPGALEKVAALAREWFATYLKSRRLGT